MSEKEIRFPEYLTEAERYALKTLVEEVASDEAVKELRLFGSRVMGMATVQSDLDVAVIINNEQARKRIVKQLEKSPDRFELFEMGVDLHVLVITREKLRTAPAGKSIEEGVVLWCRRTSTT